eukprot:Em0016g967a
MPLTAVVIVPIVSLVDDTMRRAASHGLSLTNNVSNIHNKRLIVTPEATVTQCFKDCLMQIYVQGTIFVDEVHFYTLQSQLRPTFRQLPKLWFLPVPMVLMTATAPQHVVNDLLTNFFGQERSPIIIRRPTNRLNVSYTVNFDVSADDLVHHVA